MSFVYIKNPETGKIEDITVNGKPVKRSYMRGFRKAQNTSYWKLIERYCVGRNPLSGAEIELNPLEATIYNFCIAWYRRFEYDFEMKTEKKTGKLEKAEAPRQTFDDMKYFLMEINKKAYYALLD